ncbi:hypothetical protein DERP_011179 [Dermatophagoides pteronyssinus]|uniref:Uncharacterized protein n=1 Tax=Dermatophagoides pteronyssinus TaxID=6956 RepID=A0ABQ8JD38_DERPT|nr:hypothetical protein DERP_011179 [Dermatophagoides pteronyssinus]
MYQTHPIIENYISALRTRKQVLPIKMSSVIYYPPSPQTVAEISVG